MVWIAVAGFVFIAVLLYCCLILGSRADRNIKEIMKKPQRKE